MTCGYARYLAAKTTVDDRALNRHVLAELRRLMPAGALQVLEVGAGLGTMVARLMDWGVVDTGEYILPVAAAPIHIDREAGQGVYYDPNIWIVHDVS